MSNRISLKGTVALVSGANRGIGAAFVSGLLEAGANRGGALINVLSILPRTASPAGGGYSASKAAALSLTQAVRAELRAQGTRVIGVLPGFVDTAMAAGVSAPKIQPSEVVRATLD